PPRGGVRALADRFSSADELADVPAPAVDWALGVGNPVRHAGLSEGEVVLDVGSGGGIDTVLAAKGGGRPGCRPRWPARDVRTSSGGGELGGCCPMVRLPGG